MGKNRGISMTAPAPVIDIPNRNRMHTCDMCKEQVSRRKSVEIVNTEGSRVRVCRTHDVPAINCVVTREGGILKIGTIINHTEPHDVMRMIHKDGKKKTFRTNWKDNEWIVSKSKGLVCMCFGKIPDGCISFIVTRLAKNVKSVFVEPVREGQI